MTRPGAPVCPAEGAPTPPTRSSERRGLRAGVALALTVGLVGGVRAGVAAPVRVTSSSMLPTLAPGDVVLVGEAGLSPGDLVHGDLVTFLSPQDGERGLKRVVGLPGDRVVIKDAVLHVNDRPVAEPYVDHQLIDAYYSRTFTVPPGSFFVLGDHRGNSTDSRDYGPVPDAALQGRVLAVLWPPGRP